MPEAVALDEQALQQLEQGDYVGCVFPDVFVFQSSSETGKIYIYMCGVIYDMV